MAVVFLFVLTSLVVGFCASLVARLRRIQKALPEESEKKILKGLREGTLTAEDLAELGLLRQKSLKSGR